LEAVTVLATQAEYNKHPSTAFPHLVVYDCEFARLQVSVPSEAASVTAVQEVVQSYEPDDVAAFPATHSVHDLVVLEHVLQDASHASQAVPSVAFG